MLINSPNISGSLKVTGNTTVTGSLTVLGGIIGSLTGSVATASYVEYNNVANKPTLISGSSQVTYSGLTGIPSGIVSGSGQISFNGITDKPTLVSGSSQITYSGLTGIPSDIVSGSSQITYSGLTGIPSGIVSGSAQIVGYNIFATTGSNTFQGSQTVTGSLFITQNLIVAGSSSIQYISSSVVDIADNIITVNAFNPGTRFGGLAVADSGSSPRVSGSLLFDSIKDQWIFIHETPTALTSSIVLMGPETYNDLGNETYLSANRLPKGSGIEHLRDSNITDTGTRVSINSNTEITGSLTVTTSGTINGVTITTNTASQTLTNKTIAAGSNTITGLTNSNLSGTAGITNANLANSTISGISLGSNLATLTIGTGLSGTSYNGSTGVTIANTGVTSISAGSGISVNASTGAVTITNTITNNNQLTNGAGYLTSESDTLATVTGRGASTSTALTFNGNISIPTSTLSLGSATRQMINLWGTQYGIGVQSSTTYFRSDSRFSWFRGGSHNDNQNNPGGGTVAMTLDGSSNLAVTGTISASNFSGTSSGTNTGDQTNISGNAATATNLSNNWTNWNSVGGLGSVVGILAWKNYGNNHVIFDASQGTSPSGASVNNTNSQVAWTGTYPTLMGWNGSNTYGVRVDSARIADSASALTNMNISQFTNNSGYITGVTNISGYANNLYSSDIRIISPSSHGSYRLNFGFTSWANNNSAPYADYLHLRSYSDSSGGSDNLVTFLKSGIGMRIWQQSFGSGTAYSSYVDVLHSSNYTSYTVPIGGSWYGANLPGSRWYGFSVNGGEIVFGRDLPSNGQMGILVDGAYLAGENNGFWSLPSNNDWNGRRGMYWDGSNLNFTANSPNSAFSDISIVGSAHKYLYINPGNGYEAMVRYNGGSGSGWYAGKRTSTGINSTADFHFYSEAAANDVFGITTGGIAVASGDMRAPIFYDSQNTAYYVDPASTSYLYALTLSGNAYFRPNSWIQLDGNYGIFSAVYNNAHFLANLASSYGPWRMIGNRSGWDGIYSDHSAVNGIMYDASGNGGAYREANGRWYFYYHLGNDCMGIGTSSTSSTYSLYLNKGVYAQSRIDATIFYDTNNTAYYCDPNSTSVLHTLINNVGWLEVRSNVASTNPTTESGLFFGWNKSGGNGEANIIVDGGANTGQFLFQRYNGGGSYTNIFQADIYGLTANSGTVNVFSDIRLKTNITNASPKLNDLMKLNVVNYEFVGEYNVLGKQLGFIAQEVEQIFPSLVREQDTRQYDDQGNYINGYQDTKILKVGMEFAMLVKAMQEQQSIIDSLKSEIETLKTQIQ